MAVRFGRIPDAAHVGPAHLQIAGATLRVRRLEHEISSCVPEVGERAEGQLREDSVTLCIGMGRRVDRSNRSEPTSLAVHEPPAKEHSKSDDAIVGRCNPGR